MKQYFRFLYLCIVLSYGFCVSNLEAQNAPSVSTDNIWEEIDNISTETERIDKLNQVSHSLWRNDPELSKKLAAEALKHARKIEYKHGIAAALKNIGVLIRREEKLGEALVYLEESLELFSELENHAEIVDLHIGMSTIHQTLGEPEVAMDLLLEGSRIAREHKPSELFRLNVAIGNHTYEQEDYERAIKYYLGAIEIYEQMLEEGSTEIDSGYLIVNIGFLGLANTRLQNFEKGAEYLKIYEDYYRREGSRIDIADVYGYWGEYYTLKNQPETALSYQLKAAEIFEKENKIRKLAFQYVDLGKTYRLLSEFTEAISYLEIAKKLAVESDNLELQEDIENILYRIYEQTGDNELALVHLKKYMEISQEILNEEKIKTIEDKRAQYQTETQHQKIKILEKDVKLTEAEASLRTTQLYGALGGGLFLLFFSFVLIVLYERRRRDQQLILAQNEEIMDHQDEILRHKDELIEAKDIIHQQEIIEHNQRKELEVSRAWIEGEEQERERLAGELHDQVGSMLSTVKLHLQALEARVDKLNDETTKQFQFTNHLLDKACQTVRNLSHEVSSGMVNKYGLEYALEELVENTSSVSPFELNLFIFDLEERLPKEVALNLYRIIQELLNNIIKYAEPEEVSISVTRHEDSLNIMVEDDGKGFDVEEALKRGGLGFRNIETRLNKIGGNWHIDSAIGMGTTVSIDVPTVSV